MSHLCSVPQCLNECDIYHPERYVGFCRDHTAGVLEYAIPGLSPPAEPAATSQTVGERQVDPDLTEPIDMGDPVEQEHEVENLGEKEGDHRAGGHEREER